MTKIRIILFSSICLSLLQQKLGAQALAAPSGPGGANLNNNNVVGWNNVPTNLAKENVGYSDINGTCFWNQDWLRARVVMKDGTVYNVAKAKLNLYSGEIHYMNEAGAERAVRNGVSTIVFYSPMDTSKIGIFKDIKVLLNGRLVYDQEAYVGNGIYAQILVGGKTQFLKIPIVKLIKREVDPLLKKDEWTFEPRETYFIGDAGNIKELGSISKSHLFDLVKKEDGDEQWLKAQKNKLHNEIEVITFLTYRNSLAK